MRLPTLPVLSTLLLAAALPAAAQTLPSDSAIHAILAARVDSGRTTGIIVGITENGRRRYVWHGTAGAGRAALDEHTLFEIGSISKTFTGLLLADAVARGEVRLDQPLAELLPPHVKVPSHPNGGAITLEQLSTHRSGLPRLPGNLKPANPADPYADYDTTALYAFLSGYTLSRPPGAMPEYSNLAAGLLGHVLVRRAGAASWEALVHQRILAPLGMRESYVQLPEAARPRMSAGHDPAMDSVPLWHLDALAGAGALRSTASDMLTYLEAQLDPATTPLARAIPLSQEPRADFPGGNRIALGWVVRGDSARRTWSHNGGTAGFSTIALFNRARRLGIVVLSNASVSADDIGIHLVDPSLPLRMPWVPPRTSIALSGEALERLVGEYPLAPVFVLSITREGDALYLQATGQGRLRLWPSAPDRFFLREVDAQLVFTLDADGRATAVTLVQNGREQRAQKRATPATPGAGTP